MPDTTDKTLSAAPTGAIRVTCESLPQQPAASGDLLVRPALTGGAFLLDLPADPRLSREILPHSWMWTEDDLENLDLFDAPPGRRYTVDALKVLVARGHHLILWDGEAVDTPEDLRAALAPERADAYRVRLTAAAAAAHAAEEEEDSRARRVRAAERERHDAFVATGLAGLRCTTLTWPGEALDGLERAPDGRIVGILEMAAFDGVRGDGVWYARVALPGGEVWLETYGNARRVWLPAARADALYRTWWDAGPSPLFALEASLRGFGCLGDDRARWAWDALGEEALVDMARARAPYRGDYWTVGVDATVSLVYRLRIITTWEGREIDGYGDHHLAGHIRRWTPPNDRIARLKGWIPAGEAAEAGARGRWPTADDVAALRAGTVYGPDVSDLF